MNHSDNGNLKLYFGNGINAIDVPSKEGHGVEVGWIMDSTTHFDDQIEVFTIGTDYLGLILADGVSQSAGGRIASASICEYLPRQLDSLKEMVSNEPPYQVIQAWCMQSIEKAAEDVKATFDAAKKSLGEKKTAPQALLEAAQVLKRCQESRDNLAQLDGVLEKLFTSHQSFLKAFKPLSDAVVKTVYDQSAHARVIESIETYAKDLKALASQIKKLCIDIRAFMEWIQEKKKVKSFIETTSPPLVNTMKFLGTLFDGMLDFMLGNKHKGAITRKTFEQPEDAFSNDLQAFTISKSAFIESITAIEQAMYTNLPAWLRLILDHRDRNLEDVEKLVNDMVKRLNDDKQVASASTLALVILQLNSKNIDHGQWIPFWSFSLGDPEIFLQSGDGLWIPHYSISQGTLKTFVSGTEGIYGRIDACQRQLRPGDILILASDGANIRWTTPSGFEFVPFKNLIKEVLQERQSIKSVPGAWLAKLRTVVKVDDDASMVVIRVNPSSEVHGSESCRDQEC